MKYCVHCMSPIEETDKECPFCGKPIQAEIPEHHLHPGTVLNEKILVGAALGEGGFGITYIGRDLNLDIKVAIKEYYPNGYVNRSNTTSANVTVGLSAEKQNFFNKGRERFLREARILAKFYGEPGIVDVRDFFEANNTAYIVMEYLDGQDLKEYLKEKGTISPEHTIRMLMPVMQSLTKIHKQGLIHRDISPDNIRLVGQGVKLIDFGAARSVSSEVNKSISVMLKPGYAPEEQYRSKGNQGPWTDVYALCATMYKCITGITPDDSTQRVFSDELKTPTALGITMNETLESALMKGLSVLQKDRYQSVEELINGFKGINTSVNSDGKTVYSGKPITEDDIETRYLSDTEDDIVTRANSATSSGTKDNDVTQSDASVNSRVKDDEVIKEKSATNGKAKTEPEYKPDTDNNKKVVTQNKSQKEKSEEKTAVSSDELKPEIEKNETKQNKPKKARNKRKIGIIALSAVLVIVAVVGISTIFSALNSMTISGEKVSKDADSVNLYNKTITVDDMKSLASLGKLERLKFTSCVFDDASMEYIGDIASVLKELTFQSCTGISNYKSISDLKYLTELTISDCGLTNEQLNQIDFSNKEYFISITLNKNELLSDISNLSNVSDTLTEINVSGTAVKDFTALADCNLLTTVEAIGNGIEDISTLTNNTIIYLYLDDNSISDISALRNFEYLSTFRASNNNISDISPLADHTVLYDLELNENQITDISPLANCERLGYVDLSDNQITDIKALSNCKSLGYLYLNRNKLTNLNGLEQAIELKVIQASENEITDINGLDNCTILEKVNLNENNVSDISILSKSADTLESLYFNNNKVSDISALKNTTALEYLSFDNNEVTDLDALENSTSILAISAENNQLVSMDGISNSAKLKYIYLPHNKIESMSAISNLEPRAENDFAVIDLSSNNISTLSLSGTKKFSYLAIYNNPFTSLSEIANCKGNYLLFSYIDGMDLTGFDNSFTYFKVVDCPLDKQVSVKRAIDGEYGMSVSFETSDEADQATKDAKSAILTGSTDLSDESIDEGSEIKKE